MKQPFRRAAVACIVLFTAGEFVIDTKTPVGMGDWIGYFIPLLLCRYVGGRYFSLLLAGLLTGLVYAGLHLSPPGSDIHVALINRSIGVVVLWLAAWLIVQQKRSDEQLSVINRALKTISDCNQILVRAETESALLQDICRIIVENGDYRVAWVGYAQDDEQKTVRPVAQAGETEYLKDIKVSWADNEIGRGPMGTAIRTGQASICRHIATDPLFAPWREQALKCHCASCVMLPLKFGDKVFGGLAIYSSRPNAFGDREMKLLSELAEDLSYGVQSLRTREARTRAEQELRKSERLYHTVVNAMTEGVILQTADRQIAATNPAAARIDGLNLVQQKDQDALAWDAIQEDGTPIPAEQHPSLLALTTGKPVANVIAGLRQPHGERRWVSISSQPLIAEPEQKPYAVITTFHDITEIKNATEKIRDQARFLELAHDAIIVRDLENRIIFWNRGAEQIYGWKAEEAIGRKDLQLLRIGLFQYEQARKQFSQKDDWRGEMTTFTKSGHEVLVETRWNMIRDELGKPKSILAICTDVTEKKKLEKQFYRAQRMESIGTLAAGIAHDLNNVLTPILVCVQLLKEKVVDGEDRQLLDSMEVYVNRGAGLIKQVLSFGRGAEGERAPLELEKIAREVAQIIQETFPKSLEFEFHSHANLGRVLGDATQLNQVLLNLCLNARDAMPKGGKLSIFIENVQLDDTATVIYSEARPGNYVCMSVTDTGAGIPKEIQDKIFDPFFTTKPAGKGTGLGLFTSMGIIKNHGGFIQCISGEGCGTTFKVYLPAVPESALTKPVPGDLSKVARGNGEYVLVVDDEAVIREVLQKILEYHGYRVLAAANGAEAVSVYAERKDDVRAIITDMAMPVMDGAAAIATLKRIDPSVRIIVATGMAAQDSVDAARDRGVRHFISKPYRAEDILRKLQEVLAESETGPDAGETFFFEGESS